MSGHRLGESNENKRITSTRAKAGAYCLPKAGALPEGEDYEAMRRARLEAALRRHMVETGDHRPIDDKGTADRGGSPARTAAHASSGSATALPPAPTAASSPPQQRQTATVAANGRSETPPLGGGRKGDNGGGSGGHHHQRAGGSSSAQPLKSRQTSTQLLVEDLARRLDIDADEVEEDITIFGGGRGVGSKHSGKKKKKRVETLWRLGAAPTTTTNNDDDDDDAADPPSAHFLPPVGQKTSPPKQNGDPAANNDDDDDEGDDRDLAHDVAERFLKEQGGLQPKAAKAKGPKKKGVAKRSSSAHKAESVDDGDHTAGLQGRPVTLGVKKATPAPKVSAPPAPTPKKAAPAPKAAPKKAVAPAPAGPRKKPCQYFMAGHCRNGTNCKDAHYEGDGPAPDVAAIQQALLRGGGGGGGGRRLGRHRHHHRWGDDDDDYDPRDFDDGHTDYDEPAAQYEPPRGQHGEIDLDRMSYEEILALQERIGESHNPNKLTRAELERRLPAVAFSKAAKAKPGEKHADDHTHSTCPICMDDYEEGDMCLVLPCFHRLHRDCGLDWLEVKNICPVCKFDVRDGSTRFGN